MTRYVKSAAGPAVYEGGLRRAAPRRARRGMFRLSSHHFLEGGGSYTLACGLACSSQQELDIPSSCFYVCLRVADVTEYLTMLHILASEDSYIPLWLLCITHVTNYFLGCERHRYQRGC